MVALTEMITRPAQAAGLEFEEGLVEDILEETGTEPGALALMAFALSELYKARTREDEPVTWAQYRCFVEADDGYANTAWWEGLADREEEPGEQNWKLDNHPAEHVSWYDAVAYCRWLSAKLGYEIRLPTEWEWQQAATGGNAANEYPWGGEWESDLANMDDSRLSRTHGSGDVSAWRTTRLDITGNPADWSQPMDCFTTSVTFQKNRPQFPPPALLAGCPEALALRNR